MVTVNIRINGKKISKEVMDNTLLSDFLRDGLALTGTHVGCDTSQCGACVVNLNGNSVKSCTTLVADCDGSEITTIEGLASNGKLHPMQEAFKKKHGLQCGFCTPGMVMSAVDLLKNFLSSFLSTLVPTKFAIFLSPYIFEAASFTASTIP